MPSFLQNVNGRMFELNMLVNVVPHELFLNGERPTMLERHHVFGAPVTEPPPIGASINDIEKNTSRSEFVKDIEVCSL